jgi:hypothetical protein
MSHVVTVLSRKTESDTKLAQILNGLSAKFSESFKTSFLNYAELLADASNNKDHSAVLVEAQKIVDTELAAIREGYANLEGLIRSHVTVGEAELAEWRKLRQHQEEVLRKVEDALEKHYWG